MNGRPPYLPAALGRIEGLGEKAIKGFFNEIPPELLKIVVAQLRPIAGFRPGTSAGIQRQLQSLAQKIAARRVPKSFPHSREEVALYGLWRAWSLSQIRDSAITKNLFEGLEQGDSEESGAIDGHARMAAAITALAASGTCGRETLKRFVTFSPFENVEYLQELAKSARTNAEIARDSALQELPERLHKDEARLQALESNFSGLDRNSALVQSELADVRHAVSDLRTLMEQDRAAVTELGRSVRATVEAHILVDGIVQQTNRSLDDLSEIVAEDKRTSEHIVAEVRANAIQLETLGTRLADTERAFERLDLLERKIQELFEKDFAVARAEPLDLVPNEAPSEIAPRYLDPALTVERLRVESGLTVKPLNSYFEILSSLESALVEAGLKKSMATMFAEEVLAAIATEQIIFLRGGFAVDVARKCALSLCGRSVFRTAIPFGLTDPSLLRHRLIDRPAASSGSLSCVIVEGINNSPLDLLKDVLLDQVTHRVGSLGRTEPTVLFASIADGAGAFPIETSYLELGPVFDLEQMDWRRLRSEKLPVLGSVAHDTWLSIPAAWDGKVIDYDEPLRGVRQLGHKRNARIEVNVIRAFSALKSLRQDQAGVSALQSLTYGWLAPYWLALDAKPDDIDSEIDGGKCDAATVDQRLKGILNEYRVNRTGDAE